MKTQTRIKARGYHADSFGHVNHAWYIDLIEEEAGVGWRKEEIYG